MPPEPPKRQPSRPEIIVDQEPEPQVLAQRRFDRPQVRKSTLVGMGEMKFPGSPQLPGELSPTIPARNPLQRETIRRPTPPSSVAQARRTDPPASAKPPPTSISIPADETRSGAPPARPLPPASESPDAACVEALRRRAEAAEAKAAELERQARIAVESKAPGPYQTPIERAPAPVIAPAPTTDSIRPDGSVESLRKAKTKLYLQLAGFLTVIAIPFGGWLIAIQTAAETRAKSERADVKSDSAKSTAEDAKAKAGTNAKVATALETEFRQHRANEREVWRLLGVDVPKHDGDPDPENLEPMTPFCAQGKVCPGPQLILRRSP